MALEKILKTEKAATQPSMQGIQLLPETRKTVDIKVKGSNKFLIIGMAALAVFAAASVAVNIYANSLDQKLADLDSQLTALEQRRDETAENNIVTSSRQLAVLSELLDNHVYWSQAFSKFENLMQSKVQIKSFKGDYSKVGNSIFEFAANALDFITVARQMATFLADNGTKDFIISGMKSSTAGNIEFGGELHVDPKIYFKK